MDRFSNFVCAGILVASFTVSASDAQDLLPQAGIIEFKDPPICSSFEPIPNNNPFGCEVANSGRDNNDEERKIVKINLKAQTKEITIGGHSIKTENYGTYLPPVVEARAGDTVEVTLTNALDKPLVEPKHPHHCEPDEVHPTPPLASNPTNLHYFHGGIVTTCNATSARPGHCEIEDLHGGPPDSARWGTGDNIYSCLERQQEHTFTVPIPGFEELNAAVLEGAGRISHPPGLNWYHSHLHGISSNQVMGGMAGLLSVGRRDANLRADCEELSFVECEEKTAELRRNTLVKYALLRDISLKRNDEGGWAPDPDGQNFGQGRVCGVVGQDGVTFDTRNTGLRKGFCQPDLNGDQSAADPDKLWLFTINGQKFPTIEVDETKTGVLLRLGNLSPNFAYWLELYDEEASDPANGEFVRKKMTILSVDGVVPAKPQPAADGGEQISVPSYRVPDLLLMPASRVEIYIDRREIDPAKDTAFVLRTKKLLTGSIPPQRIGAPGDEWISINPESDGWPEIQLARITFKETKRDPVLIALNASIAEPEPVVAGLLPADSADRVSRPLPPGCMRDLRNGEYRRVEFTKNDDPKIMAEWKIVTSIMRNGSVVKDENGDPLTINAPFEAYLNDDHSIKWDGGDSDLLHTCIRLDKSADASPQLWELSNPTADLHNFHIHQMKFRLATIDDLNRHGIVPPPVSSVCDGVTNCDGPDYKFYEPESSQRRSVSNLGRAEFAEGETINSIVEWHDTIPMPPFSVTVPPGREEVSSPVYVMMSFVDNAQVGRFVYHCHILKHEDSGLMAPIEVWDPKDQGL